MGCPGPSIKLLVKVTESALALHKDPTQLSVPGEKMTTPEPLWLGPTGTTAIRYAPEIH